MSKRDYYKAKLTPQQQRAAELLIDNEFGLLSEDGKKLPMEKIADMCGISRTTLYEFKKIPNFIGYKNYLSDDLLETHREQIYKALLDLALGRVGNKVPSVKALDLYLRRFGLLTDRVEHVDTTSTFTPKSPDEIQAEILKFSRMVNGEE
ncbi:MULTISPECIES: phBC6A51 family helix-turn-helix protein [unclassified Brevibacillus]|uniref:phBC6A51 family helix-turn-helix protein n=1 Tax=unclassified Brevibacillus TaxID=2684853 RepID=UPI0035670142